MIRYFLCVVAAPTFILTLAAIGAESDLKMRGWDTIPASELNATKPLIDPNAHIELTYRSLRVNDAGDKSTVFSYHNRAKIFTEAGVKELDKIDIPYQTGWRVDNIKARVVHPDGTVTVLGRGDIFKRQIFKDDKFTGYAKSFSFPGLTPGCIIEYKWKQIRRYWVPTLTIPLRAEWPTWEFDLSVNPYSSMANLIMWHNCRIDVKKKAREYILKVPRQAATSSKPYLAPRLDFEPWVHLGYAHELERLKEEDYWGYRGGALVEINKQFIKPKQRRIKDLAKELFAGIDSDEEKLRAAYGYCAEQILNIDGYQETYTEEELEDLKKNDSPNNTLKNGYGSRYDINGVFASLAASAGFVSKLAQVENHNMFTYRHGAVGDYNLSDWVVAIRNGDSWRYFDPGSSFLSFETLNSTNAKANSIQTDKKYYYMSETPAVADEFSTLNRIADVQIDEYGDLRAEVKLQYKGYSGIDRKRLFEPMTEKEMEEYVLENEWKNRLPRTTIDNFKVKNNGSRDKSLIVSYTVKIPGFADVIQDRLLFKPSLFEQGKAPLFSDETRWEPIAFDYRSRIVDRVTFEVPSGFEMESQANGLGSLKGMAVQRKAKAAMNEDSGTLVYQREFQIKDTRFNQKSYPIIKREFEHINEADARPVSFKGISSDDV